MKIAMVFDGLGFGGIERVGIDYVKLLQKLGHSVDVYNLVPNLNDMEHEFPSECKIIHHKFSNLIAPETYSYGVKKWWWGKYAYPLIHLILSAYLSCIRLFTKHRKVNYDITIAFSGHMNDLTFVVKNFLINKKKICWLHGALYNYMIAAIGYSALYQQIKNLVVLVDDAQELVLYYNKFLKLNITKMYNPTFIADRVIDEKVVAKLKEENGDYLLMVARFAYPHKDHYTVVNTVKILNEKYRKNIKAVFVGDGPEREKVKEYCHKIGVSDHIVFAGSRSDVQNYYVASCILVHASVAGEGLPTVILEAMSFGKPMVVTDSKVGPREILGNDEYGLLCKIKDPENMAKQVVRLLEDKQLYQHYQKQGYKRIEDFKPEVISKQLEQLLSRL